jgi:SRSO17 transposase
MVGQLSDLERKSIEPIALHVEGGNPRRMQSAITDALWDEDKMLSKYHTLVHQDMGDPNGVLMYDESAFVKKGEDSVGVERQYCGTIGKVDNCQVGVFEGYASRHGYALVYKRLFIPESWFDAEHEEKRKKVNLPEGYAFKTKPQLAADTFGAIVQEGTLPFKYVVADHVYGDSPEFMNAVQSKVGIVYFVEVASSNLCRPGEGPAIETKTYRFRGEARSKKVVSEEEKKPMRLAALSRKIPDAFWYRRTVSEGTKGPITYEFTKRRVTLCKDGLPTRTVWLVMKRSLDHTKCWFFISNAPLSTRLSTFVWLSGIRWAVEQCFEESKGEVGMDH